MKLFNFGSKKTKSSKQIISVPSDEGCIALINPKRYTSYKENELLNWDEFLEDMNNSIIFAWGTQRGNWNIELSFSGIKPEGYRSLTGSIVSDGMLCFAPHEELSMAAMSETTTFPLQGVDEWTIEVPEGRYICTVVQLFDPDKWAEDRVWNGKMIHYHLSLYKSDDAVPVITDLPWYDFKHCF